MSNPTPAQIEAAARAIHDLSPYITEWHTERLARAALTAAAQVQPDHLDGCECRACVDGPWQPAPEADKREDGSVAALARDPRSGTPPLPDPDGPEMDRHDYAGLRESEADEREARCPAEPRGLCAEPYCDGSKKTDEWLEDKYRVTRRDGRDAPGKKHSGCRYFVLDLTHDALARELLAQYQGSQPPAPRTVSAEEVDAARDAADTSMAMDEQEWCFLFLRALDITVEAPRG